ncbi:peptidoglycan DD-metalloendopeptidase family protein [Catellatospora sp. KI3]|uniref:peptidoglycan DD-metalloendopeptidase family protein n=1 Tax=Catellatospora sp. KI3 TaxID=3041620 RepID=UPI00248249EE|nr:peptidoglycan DD-metalloendopeptidase family protein [Catellatospora sp. KI3]MDI1464076.1 peptidoglycan DD-metalloendopeptidase family protein [Catellatospora sp. KI3]
MTPTLRLSIGGLLAACLIAMAPPAAQAAPTDLGGAVTAKLHTYAAAADQRGLAATTQVNLLRQSASGWAFGSAVLTAPHTADAHPLGWLFVARRDGRTWQVAFEGEPAFAQLSRQTPLTDGTEKRLLGQLGGAAPAFAGGDFRTGMRLPFTVGQSWYMGGGPHGWGGSDTPYSSIDLSGGDGRVLAARAGTAYTMCASGRGWIRVIHDRGYATDYYHLFNNIAANGLAVSEGTFLGNTGTDVSCGGSANGAHVHFALRQNSAYVAVTGHNYGKWVLNQGGSAYAGSALHGSVQVNAGGALYNYGALGLNQGLVDAFGGGTVNRRSGPGTGYGVVGSIADGATFTVACSANGTSHTGRYGTTALWNKMSDGTWISDAFAWTGLNGPINGWC